MEEKEEYVQAVRFYVTNCHQAAESKYRSKKWLCLIEEDMKSVTWVKTMTAPKRAKQTAFAVFCLVLLGACAPSLNSEPKKFMPANITVNSDIVADGVQTSTITLELADADNVPFSGFVPSINVTNTDQKNNLTCSELDTAGISNCILKSTRAETKTISITYPEGITETAQVKFIPGAKHHLVFSTPPSSGVAGQAISPTPSIRIYDQYDNIIDNASSSLIMKVYSDATCSTLASAPNTEGMNAVVTSTGLAEFAAAKIKKSGTYYLSAEDSSAPSIPKLCVGPLTFVPAPPATLAWDQAPSSTAIAGVTLTAQPRVKLLDAFGNLCTNATTSVTLSAYTNNVCTTLATPALNATSVAVVPISGIASFSGVNYTKSGTTYLKPTSGSATTSICSSLAITPSAASTSTSTIVGSSPAAANGFHASNITITIRDAFSNPRSGDTVSFIATNTGGSNVYGACTTTNSSGIATCQLKSNQAETKTLSITAPVNMAGGTVNFLPAPSTTYSSITGAGPVVANGSNSGSIQITLKDDAQNPLAGLTPTFVATNTENKNTHGACTPTNASGISTCSLKSTKAELKTLTITSPMNNFSGGTIQFVAGPAVAASSSIIGSSPVVADDVATSTVSITLKDTNQNPLIGTVPTFSASGTLNTLGTCSSTDNGGLSTCTLRSRKAESKTLSVTSPISFSGGAVSFTNGPTSPSESTLTVAPASQFANNSGTSTITATLKDQFGNLVPNKTVKLNSDRGSVDTISPATAISSASGTVTFTVKSSTNGTAVFSAKDQTGNVDISATASVNFTIHPTNSPASAAPSSVIADNVTTTQITVTVRDGMNTGIPGKTVTLSSSRGASVDTISPSTVITAADGTATFTVKSRTAGSAIFTARSVTEAINLSPTTTVTFTAGEPTAGNSALSASPTSITADGSAKSVIQVTLKDQFNNLVPSKQVSIVSTRPSQDSISPASATTNASGVASFTVTSTSTGSSTYSASVVSPAITVSQTATVTFTAGVTSAVKSEVTASLAALPSNGSAKSVITVVLKDAFENRVSGKTVALSSSRGSQDSISPASVSSSVSGEATFTVSSLRYGTATFTATDTSNSVALNSKPTVSYSSILANATAVSSSGNVTADGSSTGTVTVTIRDGGNFGVPGHSVTLSSSRGTNDTISPNPVTTNASGAAVFTVKSTLAGSATFTAENLTEPGVLAQNPSLQFIAGSPSTSLSTLSTSTTSLVANGSDAAQITVTLRDAYQNLISGRAITLTSSRASDVVSPTSVTSDAQGQAVFYVSSTVSGLSELSARVGPGTLVLTDTLSIQFQPGPASRVRYFTEPGTSTLITEAFFPAPIAKIEDAFGNVVTSYSGNVELSASTAANCSNSAPGSLSATANPQSVTLGLAAFTNVSYSQAETIYLKASASGLVSACFGPIIVSHWSPLPTANAPSARYRHTMLWTGSKVIVWGGHNGTSPLNSGALYDPVAKTWTPMSLTQAPSARSGHSAVWTGNSMIIWGGQDSSGHLSDGARFYPNTNSWQSLPDASSVISARHDHSAVLAGTQMIIFGGTNGSTDFGDGAVFDLTHSTWSALSLLGSPLSPRSLMHAFFDVPSQEVQFYGGINSNGSLSDGARFKLSDSSWTPLTSGPLSARTGSASTSSGSKLWIWGGVDSSSLADGAIYDASSASWSQINSNQAPSARSMSMAVEASSQIILWGGRDDQGPLQSGGIYTFDNDSWSSMLQDSHTPSARYRHEGVWTGSTMIIFGGCGNLGCSSVLNDGAVFRP
jgi:adhesin/invasin